MEKVAANQGEFVNWPELWDPWSGANSTSKKRDPCYMCHCPPSHISAATFAQAQRLKFRPITLSPSMFTVLNPPSASPCTSRQLPRFFGAVSKTISIPVPLTSACSMLLNVFVRKMTVIGGRGKNIDMFIEVGARVLDAFL